MNYENIISKISDYSFKLYFNDMGEPPIFEVLDDSFTKFLQWEEDDINRNKKSFFDLIDTDDRSRYEIEFSEIYAGISTNIKYKILKKDRYALNVIDYYFPNLDENGKLISCDVVTRIIDDEIYCTDMLSILRKRNSILSNSNSKAFLEIDMANPIGKYIIIDSNEKIFDFVDLPDNIIIHKSIDYVFTLGAPKIKQAIDTAYISGETQQFSQKHHQYLLSFEVRKVSDKYIIILIDFSEDKSNDLFADLAAINNFANKTSMTVILFNINDGLSIEFISDNISKYGFSPEDFYLKNVDIEDFFFWGDFNIWHKKFNIDFFKDNSIYENEYRIIGNTGNIFHIQDVSYLYKNEIFNVDTDDYKEKYVITIISDITKYIKTEKLLTENKNLLDATINSMPIGLLLLRRNRIHWTNKAFDKITAYNHKDINGRNWMLFFEHRKNNIFTDIDLYDYLMKNKVFSCDAKWMTFNGNIIDVSLSLKIMENREEFGDIIITVNDITKLKQYQNELLSSKENLSQLTRHLDTIREDEKKEISKIVHDELGQAMTAIKIDLTWLKDEADKKNVNKIDSIINEIDDTIVSIRRLSTDLYPPILDYVGLAGAINWASDEFIKRNSTNIKCTKIIDDKSMNLLEASKILTFRIFQEALTNVVRHAKATEVTVSFKIINDYFELIVTDNGIGISKNQIDNPTAFGLNAMKERAVALKASLEIGNNPDKGAFIKLIVPQFENNK